jgi:hypothetical protein
MGKRGKIIAVIVSLLLLFALARTCTSYLFSDNRSMVITDIILEEDSLTVRIETTNPEYSFDMVLISYKNNPFMVGLIVETNVEEAIGLGKQIVTLTVDLTEVPRAIWEETEESFLYNEHGYSKDILFINEEAELEIRAFSQTGLNTKGIITADVFIGEDSIDILEQEYYYMHWL